jgi:hypothetical protein
MRQQPRACVPLFPWCPARIIAAAREQAPDTARRTLPWCARQASMG